MNMSFRIKNFFLKSLITAMFICISVFCFCQTKHAQHIKGLDISWHNGAVDWDMVKKQNFEFIILKSTEGLDLKDKMFDTHWPKIKEHGLIRGAYHFFVTEDDPEKQADFFIKNAPLQPGDLAPIVDIELIGHGTQGALYPKLKEFLVILEKHYGVNPIVYTAPHFWNKHFHTHLKGYPLWVAQFGVDTPEVPEGWETWHIWQFTEKGTVKGVEKEVDLNKLNTIDLDISELTIPENKNIIIKDRDK